MSQSVSVWLVVLGAFCAANLPFVNQRFMAVLARSKAKPFSLRLLELVIFYLLIGSIAMLIEKRAGQITSQNWEFFAITTALFITFAFPGFVYRYLLKHQD